MVQMGRVCVGSRYWHIPSSPYFISTAAQRCKGKGGLGPEGTYRKTPQSNIISSEIHHAHLPHDHDCRNTSTAAVFVRVVMDKASTHCFWLYSTFRLAKALAFAARSRAACASAKVVDGGGTPLLIVPLVKLLERFTNRWANEVSPASSCVGLAGDGLAGDNLSLWIEMSALVSAEGGV